MLLAFSIQTTYPEGEEHSLRVVVITGTSDGPWAPHALRQFLPGFDEPVDCGDATVVIVTEPQRLLVRLLSIFVCGCRVGVYSHGSDSISRVMRVVVWGWLDGGMLWVKRRGGALAVAVINAPHILCTGSMNVRSQICSVLYRKAMRQQYNMRTNLANNLPTGIMADNDE